MINDAQSLPAPERSGAAPEVDTLPQRLGVTALVLIIIAFNAPLVAMAGFEQLSIGFGNGTGAPVSFLVAGGILLIFSVGFVGMSRYVDNPGAFYRYIVAGVGRPAGLAGAFMATTAYIFICAGAYPYMGLVAVDFMSRLIGGPLFSWQTWGFIFLLVITCTGLLRIDLSMRVLGVLVCLEVALAAVWQVAVAVQGGPEGYALSSYTWTAFTQGSAGLGTLFAMLCMCGIEGAACFSAETKNPEVAVGRATYIAVMFMALFYSLGVWLYIVTQGASHAVESAVNNPVGSFMASVQRFLGPFFVKMVSLVLVTSQMVAINAAQGSASRYLFALGRDKVLPANLGRVHGRLQSPHVAVLTITFISLIFLGIITLFRIDPVASYAAVTGMGIYFLLPLLIATSCSIIAFYRKNGHIEATRWTRWVAPGLSAIAMIVLFVLTSLNLKVLVGTPAMVLTALVTVVAIPLTGWSLALVYRTRRPSVYRAIGNQ